MVHKLAHNGRQYRRDPRRDLSQFLAENEEDETLTENLAREIMQYFYVNNNCV